MPPSLSEKDGRIIKSIKLILIIVFLLASQIYTQDNGTFTIANQNMSKTWSVLGKEINAGVAALSVFNGDLFSGGNFTTAGSVITNNIAKWNISDIQKKTKEGFISLATDEVNQWFSSGDVDLFKHTNKKFSKVIVNNFKKDFKNI